MDGFIPVFISFVALLATFYQLYLQRLHDEKSLKPLPQIDLMDRERLLFIHIQNNGVGPLIIEKLTFIKGKQSYHRIQDCLEFDPKTYDHIEISDANKKVVLPGGFFEVFSKQLDKEVPVTDLEHFRQQLSALSLKVEGRDIYNNKVVIEKNFHWFARHSNTAYLGDNQ